MPEYVPILLSATSKEDLFKEVHDVDRFVRSSLDRNKDAEAAALSDIAARASVRTPQPLRLAISVDSLGDLLKTLDVLRHTELNGDWTLRKDSAQMSECHPGAQKIAFLYPGQGSQRYGENSHLALALREYGQRVRALEERFSPIDLGRFLSQGWGEIGRSRSVDEEIAKTEVSQAMLTVLGVSTSDALAQLGIEPDFALGHSVGEFGAAYASGLIDEDEASRYVQARIRCMKDNMPVGQFGMLAIGLGLEQAESVLAVPKEVSLSSDNSTRQVVYAGPIAAIRELAADAERLDIQTGLLKTQGAFHTFYQEAPDKAFQSFLSEQPRKNHESTSVTLISSVSGQVVPDADECIALLGRQISRPVHFRTALSTLADQKPTVLIQLYGGRSLISMYKADNPGFAGFEIAFGGGEAGLSRQLSENLCKLHLAVDSFDASTILARRGTAALGHKPVIDNESVHLNNTRNKDVHMANKLTSNDVELHRSVSAGVSKSIRVSDSIATDGSSYPRDLLGLFTNQVALLREAHTGIRQSASVAPISTPAAVSTPVPILVASSPVDVKSHALDEITDFVVRTIAAQAGYAAPAISLDDSLSEGLGLDSLIVADTARRLHLNYVNWIPQQIDFASITTVGDLVQSVAGAYEEPTVLSPRPAPVAVDKPSASPLPERVQGEPFIDSFPEVVAMQERTRMMAQRGAPNPYYLEIDGSIGSHLSVDGRRLLSFSSFNYLGLAAHPRVVKAAKEAIETYGTSVSAARILSGNRPLHTELEGAISGLLNVEDAIAMVGGHCTNMSIIPHLMDQRDIIFHDSLVHDSLLRGIQASGAARHSFSHNRVDELERALAKRRGQFRRALIIVEGVYSMDGDLPPLAKIVELKERFGATLMIDEAHSIGVLGRHGGGVCEELGIDPTKIDILMGTLSKSFASCGGYLAGSRAFIQNLRYSLSGYIFSTGLTPANTAAALESIRVMKDEPHRLVQLRQNSKYFLARAKEMGFNCGSAVGVPVVPTIFADSQLTLSVADFMFENGVSVNPIMFPAVSETLARLRFFITSEHTVELIDEALSVLSRAVRSTEKLTV